MIKIFRDIMRKLLSCSENPQSPPFTSNSVYNPLLRWRFLASTTDRTRFLKIPHPSLLTSINASDSHPASPYKPPFPRPPSGPLNALGLKSKIAYWNKLRKDRNITPRTMRFINWWKERCCKILHASLFRRKKIVKEVEILDGEIQSRYNKIHRDNGLCFALVEIFNVMAELRLKAEYGDYLAYTCSALKGEGMKDMIWKIKKLDWQEVGAQIRAEETTRAEWKHRRLAPTPTPYLDDVAKAASRLGLEESLVRYQILAYADRNNFCHSGIKATAENGDFYELGEKILEDLRSLDVIFRDRPHEQIEMRSVVKLVEKEWFLRLGIDEKGKERRVKFLLTEKGAQKLLSILPAAE